MVQVSCWTHQLLQVFDHYRASGMETVFGIGYLTVDEEANESMNNMPRNLFQNANNNLKSEGGIHYIARLAGKKNPELLEHWRQKETMDISELVEAYIRFNPSSEAQGPRSLFAFFNEYDAKTGERIRFKSRRVSVEDKKRIAHGRKYTSRFNLCREEKEITFEEFVRSLIPNDLYGRMMRMPYYHRNSFTVEKLVEAYIDSDTQDTRGAVPLKQFFLSYDIVSGQPFKVKTGRGLGARYYTQFRLVRKKEPHMDFEEFIRSRISDALFSRLKETSYYADREIAGVEHIVQMYIKHKPRSRKGYVPLQSFFLYYDADTGERCVTELKRKKIRNGKPQGNRYCNAFHNDKKGTKSRRTFEDFIREKIPPELYQRMMETPYYQKHDS